MEMESRIKELIAIGASITANCQPCLQYHVEKALESGAGQQEIADAIAVGNTVRKGAAAKMDIFASGFNKTASCSADKPGKGCGCAL